MIRFLKRILAERTEPAPRAGRFTPQLESLDGRTLPSALAVGAVVADAGPVCARSIGVGEEMPSLAGAPTGEMNAITINRNTGEEIPS